MIFVKKKVQLTTLKINALFKIAQVQKNLQNIAKIIVRITANQLTNHLECHLKVRNITLFLLIQ